MPTVQTLRVSWVLMACLAACGPGGGADAGAESGVDVIADVAPDHDATLDAALDTGLDEGTSDVPTVPTDGDDAEVDAGPVEAALAITLTAPCAIVASPTAISAPPHRTLRLTVTNQPTSIAADVWPSLGGGSIGLAAGSAWVVPDDFCQVATHQFVDIRVHNHAECTPLRVPVNCP